MANQLLITLPDGSQVAVMGVPDDLPVRVMQRSRPGAMWSPSIPDNIPGNSPHHANPRANVHRGEW